MYVSISLNHGLPLTYASGGSHFGDSLTRTGHCGLGRAVSSLGLKTHGPINIDFVVCTQINFLVVICAKQTDLIHRLVDR